MSITNARIINGGGGVIESGTIIVRAGKIVSASSGWSLGKAPQNTEESGTVQTRAAKADESKEKPARLSNGSKGTSTF